MRLRLDKRTLALAFIFLIGLSILLYPVVSNTWNQILARKLMNDYDNTVENADPQDLKERIAEARRYNEGMVPKSVPDAFTIREDKRDTNYELLLNLTGDGLMGYIEIPSIKTKSPIYHYTTEESLKKGVGHLFGSSLPVGGKGTHAVLSAHRGLPSNKLFSDLDKVVVGDKFFITIFDETFAYQIDKIEIVKPDQTQGLALFEGKDYVTLVTCTPYGVNTHRILCRGVRIPYNPADENAASRRWIDWNYFLAIVGALLGILIALILVIRLRKRDRNIEQGTENKQEKKDSKIRFRRVK